MGGARCLQPTARRRAQCCLPRAGAIILGVNHALLQAMMVTLSEMSQARGDRRDRLAMQLPQFVEVVVVFPRVAAFVVG